MIGYLCMLWEVALNANPDMSFDNMQHGMGIWEIAEEINSTKAYVRKDETS